MKKYVYKEVFIFTVGWTSGIGIYTIFSQFSIPIWLVLVLTLGLAIPINIVLMLKNRR